MYIVAAYLTYLAVTVSVTVWVGFALRRNGRVFLIDAFQGDAELANSVNYLLVVGFYLVNTGFVALALRSNADLTSPRQAIELVCDKIGAALLVLGLMHFSNLYIFNRLRRRAREHPERRFGSVGDGVRRPETAPIGRVLD